jgi:hypothetical protein
LVDRAKHQVLVYRHAAKDGVLLRHVTKSSPHAALACLFHGVPLVEPDDATHRADLAGDRLEQCALASPIATEDCHRTPRWRQQAQVEEDLAVAIAGIEMLHDEQAWSVRHG